MNDQTPRKLRGTLLERAAEYYQYGLPQNDPVAPPPHQPVRAAPMPQPAPVPPPVPKPAPPPEPEPTTAPVAETETASEPRLRTGSEIAAIEPQHGVRRLAPIDRNQLREKGILVPGAPVTALAEEFRLVKRHLLTTARTIAETDNDLSRMILVCSARPDDGKTFCAINLALSMSAEKDVEILLVDADFAKPDVLETLGVTGGPGLLDMLGDASIDAEDCIIPTDVPQLSLLPAGTKTSSDTELLASSRAHAILDGLARANPRRIVIFDSPPALAASPASVLATHVGQVMLVVRADRTSESDLRDTVQLLDGCEHIELLLNNVTFSPGGRRFGEYYPEEGAAS